jgi:hypothetical protein
LTGKTQTLNLSNAAGWTPFLVTDAETGAVSFMNSPPSSGFRRVVRQ